MYSGIFFGGHKNCSLINKSFLFSITWNQLANLWLILGRLLNIWTLYKVHLWSQSLSKEFLEFKDREDHGCKHEFSRTVKTIVQRRQRSLPWTLTLENRLYPLRKETRPRLGVRRRVKHLIKFLEALRIYMERRNLSHYCLTDANLVDD